MPPAKKLSKSKLSLFLRTNCDRELYLSLHTDSELQRSGLPVPLKARPGIGVLKKAGIDFEQTKNAELFAAFPGLVLQKGYGGITSDNLVGLLAAASNTPSVILQGRFSPEQFRTAALTNLSLTPQARVHIPPLEGMIPDVIVVRQPIVDEEQVLPDGTRTPIAPGDHRRALVVIDIKHASEPNGSYSAEVALYAFMLANLLQHEGLNNQFFVSASPQLWTRSSLGQSELEKLMASTPNAPTVQKLAALLNDCDSIPFKFYMQTVRRFFREDVPRVVQIGDQNWQSLDWHVGSKCSSCDWLGYRRWLNPTDQARVTAQPDHYCAPNAELIDHLSRIVGVTKGARKTFGQHAFSTSAAVATTSGNELPYRQHSLLRKERHRIPDRASSLQTGLVTVDTQATIATLARSANLQISVSVNFDPGAGLLTGLGLSARLGFPYRAVNPVSPVSLARQSYVVDGKSAQQEWVALEAFLVQFEQLVAQAEQRFLANGFSAAGGKAATITAQVAFWERRQFEELCAALGRHLPRVLALASRRQRALAWLFPADELLERDDGAISPTIVFVEDIIRRTVSLPTAHSLTLFDAAEHYHFGANPPFIPDAFYREYLSNGIPRERIYELWSGADPIVRGATPHPRANLIAKFLDAVRAQAQALDNVVLRLRTDFRTQLRGRASSLQMSLPQGARNVSFDGKLWVWWDQLELATQSQEALIRLAEAGHVLEAAHNAICLTALISTTPNGDLVYSVSSDSSETKLDDGEDFLAVGLDQQPGFPLTSLSHHIIAGTNPYGGDQSTPHRPLYSVLSATLIAFDRTALQAVVRLTSRDSALIPFIRSSTTIPLNGPIFLVEGRSFYDPSKITRAILQDIGNPSIAAPDVNAARAMAQATPQRAGGDPITPASRVLWDPVGLQAQQKRTPNQAASVVQLAHNLQNLNSSQQSAVRDAAATALAIIWGPPGTGKTKTLVALAHALSREASDGGRGLNILVSGPTYKAVEELIGRLLDSLTADQSAGVELYVGYSRYRDPLPLAATPPHLTAKSFKIDSGDPDWNACLASLSDGSKVTIFGTTIHQVHKAAHELNDSYTYPIFDMVILDESSQIPVSRSLAAFSSLKADGQVVVAGDHLQMPPIVALEPPVGAEYLVGSVQSYLLSRNFGAPVRPSELLENYRSGRHLVEFARTIGYPQNLVSVFPQTSIHLMHPINGLEQFFPVTLPWSAAWSDILDPAFSTVTLLHEDELSSQSNEFEAKIVAALAYCLRNSASNELSGRGQVTHRFQTPKEFWSLGLGIVTPHRAQRAAVIRELRNVFPFDSVSDIVNAVDTVEKFQGGQRQVILVSFAVGDPDVIAGEESFLMQLERTNVAISRAMGKCVVIMPKSLASHIPEDKKALETAHALKGYVDEFCDLSQNISIDLGGAQYAAQRRWKA